MKIIEYIGSVGDYLIPDGWKNGGGLLLEGDRPWDSSYHGCNFRIETGHAAPLCESLPVNLVRSGLDHYDNGPRFKKCRVKIEWVQDGEPSEYSNGWLRHDII